MQVKVGAIRNDFLGFSAIAHIAHETQGVLFATIELDFSSCDLFEANMAAPLYTVIARLRNNLNDVSLVNIRNDIKRILQKNEFLSVFNIPSLLDTNQTTFPFKIFKLKNTIDQFNDYLDRLMRNRKMQNIPETLNKNFLRSLFEIFQNASAHSDSTGIFVCGQFFPKKKQIDFSIADAGIGILENVRKRTERTHVSSLAAIRWALDEGTTTRNGKHPGGIGLKIVKDFIQKNQGKLQIVSRGGYYEFTPGNNSSASKNMEYDFPGTCVNIEINTRDAGNHNLASDQ